MDSALLPSGETISEGDKFIPISTEHTGPRFGAGSAMRTAVRNGSPRPVKDIRKSRNSPPDAPSYGIRGPNYIWDPRDLKLAEKTARCTITIRPLDK